MDREEFQLLTVNGDPATGESAPLDATCIAEIALAYASLVSRYSPFGLSFTSVVLPPLPFE